jgi:hypothetical protein
MKNFNRRDNASLSAQQDFEQNEQIPMSYDNDRFDNSNRNFNNYSNFNRPFSTQPPTRNNQQFNGNKNNFSNIDNNTNSVSKSNTNINNQHHHTQPTFQLDQTPIYVPPYLLNNARPSRHNHNEPFDYLPWSIVNIFICVIIALPALFFSVQTRDMKRSGNIKKAKLNSKRSLILNIIASVVGLLTILLAVILRFALYQLFVQNDVNSMSVPIIAGG